MTTEDVKKHWGCTDREAYQRLGISRQLWYYWSRCKNGLPPKWAIKLHKMSDGALAL